MNGLESPGFSRGEDVNTLCIATWGTRTGSGHDASITNYSGGLSLNGWDAIFTVTASQAGEYAVMCEGQPSDRFGVGGNARPSFVIGGVLSIIAGGFISVLGIGDRHCGRRRGVPPAHYLIV